MRLVQMGCEVNMVASRFNQTPTHTAAFGGHPHCVVWLTQAGADVNRQVGPNYLSLFSTSVTTGHTVNLHLKCVISESVILDGDRLIEYLIKT